MEIFWQNKIFSNITQEMNENKVDLHLTGAQKNKFMKGLPFQMTSSQVSSKDGKHHICAVPSKKDYNNLLKKNSHKKGMRFSKDMKSV